jgi:hypothetical protein
MSRQIIFIIIMSNYRFLLYLSTKLIHDLHSIITLNVTLNKKFRKKQTEQSFVNEYYGQNYSYGRT